MNTSLNNPKGYVYLIRSGDTLYCKVGSAKDITKRLTNLQVGNPRELTLVAAFESSNPLQDERSLHKDLEQYHVRREWFYLPEERLQDTRWFCSKPAIANAGPAPQIVCDLRGLRDAIAQAKGIRSKLENGMQPHFVDMLVFSTNSMHPWLERVFGFKPKDLLEIHEVRLDELAEELVRDAEYAGQLIDSLPRDDSSWWNEYDLCFAAILWDAISLRDVEELGTDPLLKPEKKDAILAQFPELKRYTVNQICNV